MIVGFLRSLFVANFLLALEGCKPAIGMALKDVNNSPNLLPGFHLVLHHNDSKASGPLLERYGSFSVSVDNLQFASFYSATLASALRCSTISSTNRRSSCSYWAAVRLSAAQSLKRRRCTIWQVTQGSRSFIGRTVFLTISI